MNLAAVGAYSQRMDQILPPKLTDLELEALRQRIAIDREHPDFC